MRTIKLFLFILAINFFNIAGVANAQQALNNEKRPTICLNMIVKNESHVMERCIDSVLPLIDTWVIVDTGSTDGTQKIITDYMKKKNIPGELYERPWVNFGENREEALQLAKNKADYVLFMDADDTLRFASDFKLPKLELDSYLIISDCGGTQYYIPRLINMRRNWHWHGVLHEYVSADDAVTKDVLSGVEYIYICDGARAKDPEKYKKDVNVLLEVLKKEPNNSRYVFYLAQSYASGGESKNALETYQRRIAMGGWPEEVFWSMLQVARLQEKLQYETNEIEASYVKALKYRPTRPEPFFYLASKARLNNEFQKGYKIAKLAANLPPSNDTLFLEKWTYAALKFEHSLCAYYVGEYEESLKICDELLASTNLTAEYRMHVVANREFALEKVQEQKMMKTIDALFDNMTQASKSDNSDVKLQQRG